VKEYEPEYDCNEIVTFTAQQNSTYLWVNYTDSNLETINTTIYIYEYNHSTGNTSLYATYSNTSNNTIYLTLSINGSNTYKAVLHYNHTTCGQVVLERVAEGHPTGYPDEGTTPDRIIDLFDAMYGSNPFGWQNTIGLFVFLVCLFSFGARNSGLALIIGGGVILCLDAFIGFSIIAVTVSGVFLVLGMLIQWNRHRKEGGG